MILIKAFCKPRQKPIILFKVCALLIYINLEASSAYKLNVFTIYYCTVSFTTCDTRENINRCIPLSVWFEDVIAKSFQLFFRDTKDNGY